MLSWGPAVLLMSAPLGFAVGAPSAYMPVGSPFASPAAVVAQIAPPTGALTPGVVPSSPDSYVRSAPTMQPSKVHFGQFRSGRFDGITDVPGVGVNSLTKIAGADIRDGATVVFPNRDPWTHKVAAACYTINGNGALTNADWVNESGRLETPVVLVGNTLDVGRAYDGVIDGMIAQHPQIGKLEDVPLPVVGEIDGQRINNAPARAVSAGAVAAMLAGAHGGNFARGSVGAGTPSTAFQYKGGLGSSSRILPPALGGYSVGVLVNANMDVRDHLRMGGLPIGRILPHGDLPQMNPLAFRDRGRAKDGSIIIVVATDAPLDALQLKQLAKRTAAGLYRSGSISRISSGDQVIAFSTSRYATLDAATGALAPSQAAQITADDTLNGLFEATADATESAIDNALLASTTMRSRQAAVYGIPVDIVVKILEKYAGARVSGDTIMLPY